MELFMDIYEELLIYVNNANSNFLFLGKAGCGKSQLIKRICSGRDDIITVAPTGMAANNINGRTIQSFFGIKLNSYTANDGITKQLLNNIDKIKSSNILIIDEISMLRCEILDIVNYKLKKYRNNQNPFGGMKLLLFGDMCQMEPVVLEMDEGKLNELYPDNNGDYNFYNADVMKKDNYFNNTFDIFQIDDDFRHKDDAAFMRILDDLRTGKITDKSLGIINGQYRNALFIDEKYQHLTVTRATAKRINSYFINELNGELYHSKAITTSVNLSYNGNINNIKSQYFIELPMKVNMKVMFINNKICQNECKWINGTFGRIKDIVCDNEFNQIDYVIIEIPGKEDVKVGRETYQLSDKIKNGTEIVEVAVLKQFPFIPAWAITIDKSQWLTLDKIAVVLEKKNRPNQIYVALSRARKLSDIIILGRRMRKSDIIISKIISLFLDKISMKIIKIQKGAGLTLSKAISGQKAVPQEVKKIEVFNKELAGEAAGLRCA
jgi:hypothetical protein